MHLIYPILTFFLALTTHVSLSQVIPVARSAEWEKAGYTGTVPAYTTVKNIIDFGGSGNGSTVNDLALQNAITSLNNENGVIFFPAGVFIFNSAINLRSGLVLRGAGAGNTLLTFNLAIANNLINITGEPSSSITNITTGAFKGQSSLTVDNVSLFQVSDYIKIYQNDASLVNDTWALGSVGQVIRIENIQGNTISFSNSLRRSYQLNDAPKIRKLIMVAGVGIECLKVKRMHPTAGAGLAKSNLYFSHAVKCWVRAVESDSCDFAHIQIGNSANIEVTNSYFHGAFAYGGGGQGYGISCEYTSGDCLIENNIFKHLRHSMLLQAGANGNVFSYNYSIEPFKAESSPNDLSPDIVMHGNYPYLNLFEGNIVQNISVDASHGFNGPFNTLFRNRVESYGILISTGAGDSTNMVGNEITGTGFGKGNYLMQGIDNLEFGNNQNNAIIPTGTISLPDKSYVYTASPAFWNSSSAWPSLGIPNTLLSGTIPARERYVNASDLTSCSSLPVVYAFTGNGNWSEAANWSNNNMPPPGLATGSAIIIDPVAGGVCILNIPYTIANGATLTVMSGKIFVIEGNLTQQE